MRQSKYLKKGINLMVVTLFLLILSPIVITMGYKAIQKLDTYIVLVVGILLAITTIILFAMGIRQLLKHLFGDE
ncbi:DUF6095 family protein [Wenyingzhuangia sp. 2_MG-2023]|uniref:DUF6095 family protein n=1 Tax=Wenyingzhuangia sp. 2_MG-2023 TaxID=3062639 RepID=UPI0026E2428D|nr:DUF6095 family protein [Wenyingzhuangia sp. 2_MG-2023]MDO6738881.1 DUF6095 family protein [Wenyingzhuangia sp. 2_MG-2023]